MRPLSILFTNNTLSVRGGSELWVLDVCRALVARGHRPVAFSPVTGAVADELRAATVPVVSDLDNLAFVPDLIHGHHHVETLIAALHFPGVPIVHVCHGWLPWEEKPLRHPAIARYVAVDETCTDRLTAESGIARDVDLLLNFVDLKRFAPRSPLPPRPRRALIFSNGATDAGYAAVIREACHDMGIDVEVAGILSGRVVERPEELLPAFDLVFAKGRAALEALAVGCSVVLAEAAGSGPLVTERDFERMRACNFGVRLMQHPHAVDWYRTQIAAYDAAQAGRISMRVRREADLEQAVDRLLEIYQRAMQRDQDASSDGTTAQFQGEAQRAAAAWLSSVVAPKLKSIYALESAFGAMARELASANSLNRELTDERDILQRQVAEYRALPTLRLRDSLIRVPFLGRTGQRAARWLSRSALLR